MKKFNSVSTSMIENIKLSRGSIEKQIEDLSYYQSIVGSIMYAVIGTRFDLAFTITLLSQYNSCLNNRHLTAAKHTLRRLSGSRDFKLFFPRGRELKLEGYSDASYASCSDTRRSYSGNVFRLGGATITWKAQKQKCVTKSTTEAEYVALSLASGQMIWLKRALEELRYDVPCALFTDSTGAQDIAENPKINERIKHIDVAYHYTREKLLQKKFLLFHIASAQNHANLMTKPLEKQLYDRHTNALSCDTEKEC